MSIVIRKAEMRDIPAIQKVAKVSWNDTYKALIPEPIQEKFLMKAYSDERMVMRVEQTHLFVAEEDGEVVGFANASTKDNVAELIAIYLYPEVQGRGIGSNLLTEILDQLKNSKKLYVEVEKGNVVGEAFYEARDFHIVKEYEEDFYGHKLQTKRLVFNVDGRGNSPRAIF